MMHEMEKKNSNSIHSFYKEYIAFNVSMTKKKDELRGLTMKALAMFFAATLFINEEFYEIIQNATYTNPEWSASEASDGFRHLELIILTLLNHPYKTDYKSIKLYNGPFQVKVASKIKNCTKVLELIGYHASMANTQLFVLQGPVDPEVLVPIACQCFIASIECTILSQIYNKVNHKGYTMMDVVSSRLKFIGDPDKSAMFITQTFKPSKDDPNLQENLKSKSEPVKINDTFVRQSSRGPGDGVVVVHESFNDKELYGLSSVANREHAVDRRDEPRRRSTDNDSDSDMIEADIGDSNVDVDITEEGDFDDHLHAAASLLILEQPVTKQLSASHSGHSSFPSVSKGTGHSSDWDFVTSKLKGQYGSSYYHGDRGEFLGVEDDRQTRPAPKPCSMQIKSSLERPRLLPSSGIVADGSSSPAVIQPYTEDHGPGVRTLQIGKGNQTIHETLEMDSGPKDEADAYIQKSRPSMPSESWQCLGCTLVNKPHTNVCEICGKSHHFPIKDEPLQLGGTICRHCTLINEPDRDLCSTCESPLDNSHTYI